VGVLALGTFLATALAKEELHQAIALFLLLL
jgi:hypothetical protein